MMANSRNLIRNIRVTKPAQDTVGLENLAPFVRCNSSRVGMQLANLRLTSPRNNLVHLTKLRRAHYPVVAGAQFGSE